MRSWGAILFIVGAGSFLAPKFGFQFMIIGAFGEAAPIAGIAAAVIGAGLFAASLLVGRGGGGRGSDAENE